MTVASGSRRLRVAGISKSFAGTQVLHEISFEANAGEVVGLVGENGCGKSTTMNILAGVLRADAGHIYLDGETYAPADRRASEAAGVAFIQQELNIFPNLSVAENLFLGRFPRIMRHLPFLSYRAMLRRARQLLDELDVDIDPAILAGTLGPGERQLLEIARGLSMRAQVMIFDEPTTSLSARETQRLFLIIDRLRSQGVAIIFISHVLADVLRLSDRLLVLRDGRVTLTALRGGVDAAGLVKAMVGRSIDALFPVRSTSPPEVDCVLRVENVTEPGLVHDINFEVGRGEIVGIAGLMGAGRTELARVLFGLEGHRQGRIHVNEQLLPAGDVSAALALGMAFLTEDRRTEGLMLDASVAENLALAALPDFSSPRCGRIRASELRARVAQTAQSLQVKCRDIERSPIRSLSGGNQQKVLIGRWLLRRPALFILDEPSRGVDVGARSEIYRLLAQMAADGMALLVISSELEELMGLCDRILVMRAGRLQGGCDRTQFATEKLLGLAFGQGDTA